MSFSVKISLKVFIPSEAVTFSILGYGGTFNGGVKCEPAATIDLSMNGESSLSFPEPAWGETRSYDDTDASAVSGKPDWYRQLNSGAAVVETKRLDRTTDNLNATFEVPTGASHGVKFFVVGANPLLSYAPAIDAEIKVGLRIINGELEVMAAGSHDGFPSYSLVVNGMEIYSHDCVAEAQDPSDLAPPMEYSVDVDWRSL